MNITSPKLIEGADFRRLSVKEGYGKYRFKTLVPTFYAFSGPILPCHSRRSFMVDGKEWLYLTSSSATVSAGYAWNGSSPKCGFRIFGHDVWTGTPDFQGTLAASLIHDALFQFSGLSEMPFSRDEANDFYHQLCKQNSFGLGHLYFGALKGFSPPFWGKKSPGQSVKEF